MTKMDAMIGKSLGPYQIVERIGRGGMATVYKAYQPALDRYVAVKVLPAHVAETPGFSQRFQREARAVARLEHPHILPIYDFGQQDDLSYLVMRYIEGGTLKDVLGKSVPIGKAAKMIGEVAEALDYAHERGVIHRDVKPSNILLDPEGRTFLTDFGVARILEATQQLTGTGVGIGTPAYMSPEQGQGRKVDRRSDVYSLGVVLYEMLTGEVPYQAETPIAVVLKHINDPLPLPRKVNPAIPEAVERVMLKALAKSPEDRFQTAQDMARALQAAAPVPAPSVAEAVARVGGQPNGTGLPEALPSVEKKAWRWRWVVAVVVVAAGGVLLNMAGLLPGAPAPGTSESVAESTVSAAPTQTEPATTNLPVETPIAMMAATGELTIYDDFNDPTYEGSLNPDLWIQDLSGSCETAQEQGSLRVSNPVTDVDSECKLWLKDVLLDGAVGGSFEAQIRLSRDHSDGWAETGIRLVAPGLSRGDWIALCSLKTDSAGPGAFFQIYDFVGQDIDVTGQADYNRWHSLRLDVDPGGARVACSVDDVELGSMVPTLARELEGSRLRMDVHSWRPAGAYGTAYVDDVRVTLAARAPQGVKASPAAGEAYMTPLPGADSTNWQHITFNLDDSIVGNLAVRQAIAYATFRQALGDAWSPPYSPVILNSYIRPDSPYYAGDPYLTLYPYDVERAKSILEQVGWVDADGDGIRERDGVPLSLRYLTNDLPQRKALALAFEGQMKAIGIDIAVEIVTWNTLMEAVIHGDFQLAQFGWKEEEEAFIPTGAFAEGCEFLFHSSCIPTTATNWKGSNLSRLQSAEMDRLLEELLQASSFEERRAILIKTQAVFTRELPILPLFCVPQE